MSAPAFTALIRRCRAWARTLPGLVRSHPRSTLATVGIGAAIWVKLALAATFTVTSIADTGGSTCAASCTLRQAINAANASLAAGNIIAFSIPSGSCSAGICTISPTSALPAITRAVTIDGTTQTGWTSTPVVELKGTSAGAGVNGLTLSAATGVTVRGLAIRNFGGSGIVVNGGSANTLTGNHIGIDAAGSTAAGNGSYGIYLASPSNLIGGTTATARNVIGGNGSDGVYLDTAASATIVKGNYIGSNAAGTGAIANTGNGIFVLSTGNAFGGTASGAGNLLSGNTLDGIWIQADSNTVQGNLIGLNATGTSKLRNGRSGIVLAAADSNVIGGSAAGARNIIAGHDSVADFYDGIYIWNGSDGNTIQGNYIGTDISGTVGIGNAHAGIGIWGGSNNIVGGTAAGEGNLLAFNNHGVDVRYDSAAVSGNRISGNSIHSNTSAGIALESGLPANDGTTTANKGNLLTDSPVLSSAGYNGSTLTVSGYVGSAAGQAAFANHTVEFFASATSSGRGQGRTWLGSLSTSGSNGNFSGGISVSGLASGTYITATARSSSGNTSIFSTVLLPTFSFTLSGTVFEDLNYGGGAGRNKAAALAAGGSARAGARLELFSISGTTGTIIATGNSDASGNYSFGGLPGGNYAVRVVSSTVKSARNPTATGMVPITTFRTDASSGTPVDVTNEVGGVAPAVTAYSVLSGNVGDSSSMTVAHAEAVTFVTLSSGNIAGLDFGFNFDTVTNLNNNAQGSLRQVLTHANTLGGGSTMAVSGRSAGIEHVIFMVSNGTAAAGLRAGVNYFSGGVATISPTSTLPTVANPLVIDAQTQPGWVLAPIVQINGSGAGASHGLTFNGDGTIVRGLVINRFARDALHSDGGAGHVIQGNWLGTTAAGSAISANGLSSININSNAGGHVIGGLAAAQRNVLSGNTSWAGVTIGDGPNVQVIGNYIGANATGTAVIANGQYGVWLQSGGSITIDNNLIVGSGTQGIYIQAGTATITGNIIGLNAAGTAALPNAQNGILIAGGSATIGGTTAAARNVIAGNTQAGISVTGGTATVQGNYLGTNAAGNAVVANGGNGISLASSGNTVGGTATGAGNLIRGNGGRGVAVASGAYTGNALRRNAIYGNTSIGIDLKADGITANDGAKTAGTSNLSMDAPVFSSANLSGTTLTVTGYVGSAAGQSAFAAAQVEVFVSDGSASAGSGQTWLGTLTADASGNFSGTLSGVSGLTAGSSKITGTATDTANNSSEFGSNFTITAGRAISGTVFEDKDYGGGAGRSLAGSGGAGVASAIVELYDSAGSYVSSTTTAAGGGYSFPSLAAGTYHVRVVNSSVTSRRSGSLASLRGVMTFRTHANAGTPVPVTDWVGGTNPALVDPGAGASGAAFNTSTGVFGSGLSGTAQSYSAVALSGSDIAGIDFGFNFSTIVNTNDSGQGSLRQFIANASALGDKPSLAQAGFTRSLANGATALPAATETSIFMIPGGVAVAGLRAAVASQLTAGVARITIGSLLPPVGADKVSIDGATQTANIGDGNAAWLGSGGTVGADGLALSQLAAPEVELTFASLASGITIAANNVTVRALALRSTGTSALGSGAVAVSNDTTGAVIEGNLIGSVAGALSDPGATLRIGIGVMSNGGDSAIVRNNLITYFTTTGVQLTGTLSSTWTISNNEIREGGLDFNNADGVALSSATGTTISGNRITGMSTQAVVVGAGSGSGTQVINNTISGNGVGPTASGSIQSAAVTARSGAASVRLEANIISANYGAGVSVNSGASGIALTRNLIHGNGSIASRNGSAATGQIDIDLNAGGDNIDLGTAPFVTANDSGDGDSGGNNLQNSPVLSSAVVAGSQVTISGSLNSNAGGYYRIEFFSATSANASGRGGGQTYLGFTNVATDGSGNATFSVTLSASIVAGSSVTATATRSNSGYTTLSDTSEFAANATAGVSIGGTVFEDIHYGGGAGRSKVASGGAAVVGAVVELIGSDGVLLASTSTAADGSYQFAGVSLGHYIVRVPVATVRSTRSGTSAAAVGVSTWRYEASWTSPGAVTDQVGGLDPAASDGATGVASYGWTACAVENASCSFSGTRLVRYGAGSSWTTRVLTGGTPCTNAVFGDPLNGTVKACQLLNASLHSLSSVSTVGGNVAGVDFGFNFDTVANSNDSGAGSLRQAITNANALGDDHLLAQSGRTAGIENLVFMIGNGSAAAGLRPSLNYFTTTAGSRTVATITPTTALPPLSTAMVIDAQTQPGWTLDPVIEIRGSSAGSNSGIVMSAGFTTLRGLIVNRFGGDGISASAGGSYTIQGCWVGVDASGTAAAANTGSGISISAPSNGTLVGGSTSAAGNLISGNGSIGVSVPGSGVTISGNTIGLNAARNAALGNAQQGVRLSGSNNTVGGTTTGAGNWISGNTGAGVAVAGAVSGNAVLGNSIYGNGGIGIDLGVDGVTVNDGSKTAGQPNLKTDAPVFTSGRARGNQLTVAGYVGSAAGQSTFAGSRVEVFVSDNDGPGHGEGKTWLGSLTADASGNFSGTLTMPLATLTIGNKLTGSATDGSNNSSEFGANFAGLIVDFVVNSNLDDDDANPGDGNCLTASGWCTLRAAISELNAWPALGSLPTVIFAMPGCSGAGAAACIISPATALPAISRAMVIDAQTQPGWTLAPIVELSGGGAPSFANGLNIAAAGTTVRGLVIGGFGQSGIVIAADNALLEGNVIGLAGDGVSAHGNGSAGSATGGVLVSSGSGSVIGGSTAAQRNVLSGNGGAGFWANGGSATVIGNYIGTNAAGNAAVSNGRAGVMLAAGSGHHIGGPASGQGNLISGNSAPSASGIDIAGSGQVIQGNRIGLNAAGNGTIPNGDAGSVHSAGIDVRGGSGHVIGGSGSGEGNIVAGNQGYGIRVDAQATRISANTLYDNLWLGIDLAADGVSANDGATAAGQPNNGIDHPLLTGAGVGAAQTTLAVSGYIGTGGGQAAFAGATVEFFKAAVDASGYGEGRVFLGTLVADGSGRFNGTLAFADGLVVVGDAITATATDTSGNTSEFGPNWTSTTIEGMSPAAFNAFDTDAAAAAITGVIRSRVAGAATPLAIVALNAAANALHPGFTGNVSLSWVDARDDSGVATGSCRASWPSLGAAGTASFTGLSRITVSVTPPPTGTRVMRLKISYVGPTSTVEDCSNDAFAALPATLTLAASDSDSATAGSTRALDNVAASGGVVHRAGRPFTVSSQARDATGALMTGYDGTPVLALTGCVLPASCSAGTLGGTATAAVAGVLNNPTVSYSEVGAVSLQLSDTSYAAVDSADTSVAARSFGSAVVDVGRFVPDSLVASVSTSGQFNTANGSCLASGSGATFFGQGFGWTVVPQVTVTAKNAAGATTALWTGALMKLTPATQLPGLVVGGAGSATLASSFGAIAVSDLGGGQASLTASSADRFLLDLAAGTQQASLTPTWTWSLAVSDASEAAVAGNPTLSTSAAQAAVGFDQGAIFHSARLALSAAHGDARAGVRSLVQLQRWTSAGWVTMTEDRGCITVQPQNLGVESPSGIFASSADCVAPMTASATTAGGRAWLSLPATPGAAPGRLLLRLAGDAATGHSCSSAGASAALVSMGLPWLLGGSGGTGPAALATWGTPNRDVVLRRETW